MSGPAALINMRPTARVRASIMGARKLVYGRQREWGLTELGDSSSMGSVGSILFCRVLKWCVVTELGVGSSMHIVGCIFYAGF